MKRIILLLLVITAIGCSKDDKGDGTITQKGLMPAPDWLVGTWASEEEENRFTIDEKGNIVFFMTIQWEKPPKKEILDIHLTKDLKEENVTVTQFKNDRIFYFFYPYRFIEIDDEKAPFVKWEFKKISKNKIDVSEYLCYRDGTPKEGEDTRPTTYTKVK